MGDSRTQEEVEHQFTDKDKLGIDSSIAAHIRWRKTYKASWTGVCRSSASLIFWIICEMYGDGFILSSGLNKKISALRM